MNVYALFALLCCFCRVERIFVRAVLTDLAFISLNLANYLGLE